MKFSSTNSFTTLFGIALFASLDGALAVNRNKVVEYEPIAGYTPATLVTSHNALDLDQKEFMKRVALGTIEGYETAMRIYTEGAFSEPMAYLNLTTPLQEALEIGDEVIGTSEDSGEEVTGLIVNNYPRGTRRIRVMYQTNEVQSSYVDCQVAANPDPNLEGCFGSDGLLVVTGFSRSLSYTYNPLKDNVSNRYLERLSTGARVQMELCMNCPYVDYLKFRDYYGSGDYADQWVRAALEGKRTAFLNGNADFRPYGEDGKYEAMTKATAYMAIWMYVIREMEDALDDCEFQQKIDSGVNSWDKAVAFYTGSLEGTEGTPDQGVLIYNLAEERCRNFRTCGDYSKSGEGTSYVNLNIFEEFRAGQDKLQQSDCDGARENKERIVQLMTIPLIQGTLRWAYYQGSGEILTEKAEAEGATFAAAILPYIHACGDGGEADAAIIYENMKTGHGPTNFQQVKTAFERNYKCLGLTCAEVGGVWDEEAQRHREGAMPCTGNGPELKEAPVNGGLALGLGVGILACLGMMVTVTTCLGRKPAPAPFIPPPGEII